ncbi:heavy-metal-associated domain-containing protein [Amycolatopsis sp. SID8362]|uniref:heavy-metal-associated domain-containing protein n=1 Tax=Amycolatopsis sp. SID8362 TaxID=2690346 RepID=UPI00136A9D16|nr:heavy-metal-associated domain-containing protein [Amycolatopsis sp. SID8362]NBH03472.1 copper resistance protein CopZ [Amycolatopsis sp. SID8362]NED40172.1 heavy-metal-associated domain-containing protein [Amycolatopsis sp. SID8362]
METSVYTVKGMTCSGCMNKVTGAVGGVAGVSQVDADIASGELTVVSEGPVDAQLVRSAVKEAGYEVVS